MPNCLAKRSAPAGEREPTAVTSWPVSCRSLVNNSAIQPVARMPHLRPFAMLVSPLGKVPPPLLSLPAGLASRCGPISVRREGLIAEGEAVLAVVGAADQHAARVIDPDRLAAAERFGGPRHGVTACLEVGGDRCADAGFERQRAVEGETARAVAGGLRVHAAIEHLAENVGMTHRLILAAHDAERHDRATVLFE